MRVSLSYAEQILNALGRVERKRGDDCITRMVKEAKAINEVLGPLFEEMNALRSALDGMMLKWAPHCGLCCTFANGRVEVTDRSCVCDLPERAGRAALALGQPSSDVERMGK